MANYGALGGVRAGPGRHCCGAAEEAAAREFHKHEAESFLVFLSWGVWLSQPLLICVYVCVLGEAGDSEHVPVFALACRCIRGSESW